MAVSQSSLDHRRQEVMARLFSFLQEERPHDTESIENETNLFDVGVLDSLLIVSLVVFIEEEFRCTLDFDDLTEDNLGSLTAMADLVLRQSP